MKGSKGLFSSVSNGNSINIITIDDVTKQRLPRMSSCEQESDVHIQTCIL